MDMRKNLFATFGAVTTAHGMMAAVAAAQGGDRAQGAALGHGFLAIREGAVGPGRVLNMPYVHNMITSHIGCLLRITNCLSDPICVFFSFLLFICLSFWFSSFRSSTKLTTSKSTYIALSAKVHYHIDCMSP